MRMFGPPGATSCAALNDPNAMGFGAVVPSMQETRTMAASALSALRRAENSMGWPNGWRSPLGVERLRDSSRGRGPQPQGDREETRPLPADRPSCGLASAAGVNPDLEIRCSTGDCRRLDGEAGELTGAEAMDPCGTDRGAFGEMKSLGQAGLSGDHGDCVLRDGLAVLDRLLETDRIDRHGPAEVDHPTVTEPF